MKKQTVITRDLIGQSFILHNIDCRNEAHDKGMLVSYINKWHTVFNEYKLKRGDKVTYVGNFDSFCLSFFIAVCEYGLTFCVFRDKNAGFISDYNRDGTALKFLVATSDIIQDWKPFLENIHTFNVDHLLNYEQAVNPSIQPEEHDVIYTSLTSGTTGPPTVVRHNHKSILNASYKSVDLFYKNKKIKSVTVNHLHHAGSMSIQYIPALISGAYCYFVGYDDVFEALTVVRPNVCVLFNTQLQRFKSNNKELFDTIDLSYIDTVITGGTILEEEFLTFLLERGVQRVYDVYGATQSLVPVLYGEYTKEDMDAGFNSKFKTIKGYFHRRPTFPYLATGWEYVIDNETGELLLKGDALSADCMGMDYYRTGDVFEIIDDVITYKSRYSRPLTCRNGTIIDPNNVMKIIRKHFSLHVSDFRGSIKQDYDKNITLNITMKHNGLRDRVNFDVQQVNDVLAKNLIGSNVIDKLNINSMVQVIDLGAIK